MKRLLKPAAPIALLLLSACSGGGGGGDAQGLSATAVADREITGNTSDTTTPISINGNDITDNDLSDSALPMAL